MENEKLIDIYRKRDFGDLLQDSLRFVAWNAVPLLKAILIFVGPLLLISAILTVWFIGDPWANIDIQDLMNDPTSMMMVFAEMAASGPSPGIAFLSALVGMAIGIVRNAAINSFIIRYGETKTGALDTQDMKDDILKHFLPYLGLSILQGLIVAGIYIAGALLIALLVGMTESIGLAFILGLLLLAALAYFGVPLAFNSFTRMYEGPSNTDAIRKGYKIIKGAWWQTFGLFVVLAFIAIGVSLVLGVIGGIFAFSGGSLAFITLIWTVASAVISSLIMAMFSTAAALQYFNLTDGPVVDERIDDIGSDNSTDPFQ
jgi:hypothetical protein